MLKILLGDELIWQSDRCCRLRNAADIQIGKRRIGKRRIAIDVKVTHSCQMTENDKVAADLPARERQIVGGQVIDIRLRC